MKFKKLIMPIILTVTTAFSTTVPAFACGNILITKTNYNILDLYKVPDVEAIGEAYTKDLIAYFVPNSPIELFYTLIPSGQKVDLYDVQPGKVVEITDANYVIVHPLKLIDGEVYNDYDYDLTQDNIWRDVTERFEYDEKTGEKLPVLNGYINIEREGYYAISASNNTSLGPVFLYKTMIIHVVSDGENTEHNYSYTTKDENTESNIETDVNTDTEKDTDTNTETDTNIDTEKDTDTDNNTNTDTNKNIKFTDVPSNAYYNEAINWAVENNITSGISATQFSPDKTCTRGQVVSFIWRAMGQPEPTINENPFIDVSENDYNYKAILWAYENGIASGITNNIFGSDEYCTRSQVVTFLWRAAGQQTTTLNNSFIDVRKNSYFINAINWAVENGITSGTSNSTFGVDEYCTRSQVVTFLYRNYLNNK